MPGAAPVIGLGAAVGGSYLASLGGGYIAAGLVLSIGGAVAASALAKSGGSGGGRDLSGGGHQVNTRSSREPLPVCYGQFRTGVNKTFLHVENPYLYMIAEIGEGEINGIVREDDTIYTTTGSELPTGNPPLVYLDDQLFTKYGNLVRIEFYNGSSTQNVCSHLQSATSKWDQTLRHTAYLYIRLKYDPDKFNAEPQITVVIQGTKIFNPVTGDYARITTYSNNPALCAYDFITRSAQRGGIGISEDRMDVTALSSAIDYCDAKGWTCNMPISSDQAVVDNLQHILNCFRGDVILSAEKLKIKYRDLNYESSVMALTESDVVQSSDGFSTLEIMQPDAARRPNAIRATHLSSEKRFKADDIITSAEDAVTAEGDYRETKIELFGLSDPDMVQKMSNYYLERLRLNKTVSLVAGSRAIALEPMDIVTLEHDMPGWDAQLLRVQSAPINGDHTVSLTLIEEATTFYDDTYNLTVHDYDSTDLPGPLDVVPAVVNVSEAEEVYYYRDRSFTRWKIDFDAPAAVDYPWWDYAEIWLKIDDGDWRYMTRCDTNYQVDPVEEGVTYSIKIRSVSVFGAKEDFDSCTTVSSTITGPTDAPGDLDDLMAIATGDTVTIFATPLNEPDIDGYEIRLGASWDGGIFISYNKNISLRINGVRPGTHTFWAAAKNNGGNYSTTPASASVTVFVPPGYSELATYGSWSWDFTSGTHNNTEHVTYDTEDAVKCSHTGSVLTGDWTSPTYDLNAIEKVRVWGDFRMALVSSNTTWDGVFPLTTSAPVGELITDGDFNNWSGDDPDDWTESNCDAAEDTGESGSAARVTVTSDGYGINQTFSVTAERYYVLRGYYKNTAGDMAQIWIADISNGGYLSSPDSLDLADSTSDFSAFAYTFYTPVGCTSVRLWLSGATSGDVVWFDSISVQEIDTANSATWDDIDSGADMSWNELFQPLSAAQLNATMRYKQLVGDSWTEVGFFELICSEVEARYISVVITITDPTLDSNLYLKELNMSAYEGPQ